MNNLSRQFRHFVFALALSLAGPLAAGQPGEPNSGWKELEEFASRYAAAWSSQDPDLLASFYAENGVLQVNDGEPSVGREAVSETARGFMAAFPDMTVRLLELRAVGDHLQFHWRWTGTFSGPGGNGRSVDLLGYEQWTLDDDGMILRSLGHYDEAEYQRQLGAGPDDDHSGTHEPRALSDMLDAATAWLESLGPGLKEQAIFSLDDSERKAWSNLPASMFKREGVSFGQMSALQRRLAHRLMRSTLSSQGYLKASGIMHLDEILKGMTESDELQFGQENYWIGIFGNPEKDAAWGWQLDGHHLALNFTVVGDRLSVTPAFLGSDPAEVLGGVEAGWYVLSDEDKQGRALWALLDPDQRAAALLDGETPRDVITGAGRGDRAPDISGLPLADMNGQQREKFMNLLQVYLGNLVPELAAEQRRRILDAGIDKLHFAWSGTEQGKPYYYRIHGPTVLIEFDNSYPPGRQSGEINHIHSIWRDSERDFGEDLLRQHYETSPHHQ